jgi:Ser/Thr protein kinase RdoA (MazF antagonist)
MAEDAAKLLSMLRERALGRQFRSRKNRVYLSLYDDEPVVVKELSDSEKASKEHAILSMCVAGGVPVPRPLAVLGNALVLEYIEGGTAADLLDSMWIKGATPSADVPAALAGAAAALGEWLAEFHKVSEFRIARGDANMRNFIMRGHAVVGVDFEECRESDVISDLGQMCSSVLSMNPMFTDEKLEFCRMMSGTYFDSVKMDRAGDLDSATAEALRYYAAFRDDGREMVRFALSIERTGLFSEK